MIPRYELHRHLGGSIDVDFIHGLSRKHGLGWSRRYIEKVLLFSPNEERSFYNFLSKFHILDKVPWDTDDIFNVAHHIVEDVEKEGIEPGLFIKETEKVKEGDPPYFEERKLDDIVYKALDIEVAAQSTGG